MKLGRFIVETHCHGQRHAARMSSDEGGYSRLSEKMHAAVPGDEATDDDDVVVYDNSDRLVYDMENYGVDMCVLLPAFGMENTIDQKIMEKYPDKFVSAAAAVQTKKKHYRGEEEWTIDAACEEIDEWLGKDGFRLIGEGFGARDPTLEERMEWHDEREHVRKLFEVAADNDVPISWHTGNSSAGYGAGIHMTEAGDDPTLAGEMKMEFPDVPVIFDHGGMQAGWREDKVDMCCQVAASWDDVYLEVGMYWADLFKKPYHDPNIGPEQMLWGGDWGASLPQVSQPGQEPPFYWQQVNDRGLPAHQPDYWGAAYRQLLKFALDQDIEQDKLNLVLGGNAARLLDLEVPETRLFEQYLQT